MTPDEQRSKLKRLEESSRGPKFTLAVILIAVSVALAGTGLYMYYGPADVRMASAACPERFEAMDKMDSNGSLEYGEVLTYGKILSSEVFAEVDQNKDNALSVDEFCTWEAKVAS